MKAFQIEQDITINATGPRPWNPRGAEVEAHVLWDALMSKEDYLELFARTLERMMKAEVEALHHYRIPRKDIEVSLSFRMPTPPKDEA